MTVTQIFTVFAGVLAIAGAYLYFFGIDPETKRALEKKALQTMGENKMSYLAKGMFPRPTPPSSPNTSRPNQQDPRIRPGRRQEPQADTRERRRWRDQQPSGRASW
jgi:hypothetical protein